MTPTKTTKKTLLSPTSLSSPSPPDLCENRREKVRGWSRQVSGARLHEGVMKLNENNRRCKQKKKKISCMQSCPRRTVELYQGKLLLNSSPSSLLKLHCPAGSQHLVRFRPGRRLLLQVPSPRSWLVQM
ncbi:hypothetical protein INR49_026278 [Caranx melampygus]|nr:hypothetical protein INR49_026278 [Caranx melampygus]